MYRISKRGLCLLLCVALMSVTLVIRTLASHGLITDTSTRVSLTTGTESTEVKFEVKAKSAPERLAEELSKIVQTQLANLQSPKDCSVPTLSCGHYHGCGLGCQIHHRIACLMISYASGMPLIHETSYHWPYSKSWNQIFYPLGSQCTPGPNTRKMNNTVKMTFAKAMTTTGPTFPFPLDRGIVVPRVLADKVRSIHPFFWWIGQFMKYGLRLLPAEREMVQSAQDSVKFSHPIVGIHVRRTDKIREDPHALHGIEEYFAVADEYYSNLTREGIQFEVKRVFVSSDDQSVLNETKTRFPSPEWDVIGLRHGRTLRRPRARRRALDDIVQDLITLADCDYVVCTHSSNVCRVLAGMLNINHTNGFLRLTSIDGNPYVYLLYESKIPMEIIKI